MRLLLATLLLISLGSTAATAKDAAQSIVKTETQAGQFYSSQLSLDQGFPFSDMVETKGGLVFSPGLWVPMRPVSWCRAGSRPRTTRSFDR